MPVDYNRRIQDEDTTIGTPSGIVSTTTPQTSPSSQGSGQFSNLQDYIRANEGDRNYTASRVGEDIGNKYQSAISDINQSVGQIGQNRQALDTQRNQFNSVVAGAGTNAITPEQIANARNMALGISGTDFSPKEQASSTMTEAEAKRQSRASELKNIGSGSAIQEYLKSVRSNPSSSTAGETRLDEFLTRQTPEGSSQLQSASSKASDLEKNRQLQDAMKEVESSYGQLTPGSLSDYVRKAREGYQTGLGDVNKKRASQVSMERRGISDLNQARAAYENSLATARANDQSLANYAASVNQANQLISQYNDIIGQAPGLGRSGNVQRLQELMNAYGIQPDSLNNVDPRYGTRATAAENDLVGGLGSLRSQRYAEIDAANRAIAEREAAILSNIQSSDPYSLYSSDIANARTREASLRPEELARLQALYSLSGEDQAYRNYITGGIV